MKKLSILVALLGITLITGCAAGEITNTKEPIKVEDKLTVGEEGKKPTKETSIKEPVKETPKEETPKKEDVIKEPVKEIPKEEPVKEEPKEEAPKTPVINNDIQAFENEVISLTNIERQKNGLKPLKANNELSNVARIKSKDMIDKKYFDHTSPTYGSPFDMMKKFGIIYMTAGENIAYGQRTPQEVVTGWLNSEGHRRNIMNPNFTEIGVGLAKTNNGTNYWTQMFIGK